MFWSRIAGIYDLIENVYNGKANRRTTGYVASLMEKDDRVLECACGTGMFSVEIAPRVKELTATDFSPVRPGVISCFTVSSFLYLQMGWLIIYDC